MKVQLLIGAALLFSVAAFAQSTEAGKQRKNNHGTNVSTEAKSEMEAGTKGEAVSATASSKSHTSINAGDTPEARDHRKAERESAREARKQEQKDFVAGVKTDAEARKTDAAEISADVRAEAESRKAMSKESRKEAREAREAAKAERKASDDGLVDADAKVKIGKADKKAAKETRPERVKVGAKAGTDVQISRPKVGAKVRGTAGLGIL